MKNICENLVHKLQERNLKIAVAESCTGGLISELITSVSGASQVFECGICSYSNEIKHRILGVEKTTLDEFGAVSEETAGEMALKVRLIAKSDIGISATGIAGPTGGTDKKPVGLVYIAVSMDKRTTVKKFLFNKDKTYTRDEIRRMTAFEALNLALSLIQE